MHQEEEEDGLYMSPVSPMLADNYPHFTDEGTEAHLNVTELL